MCSEWGDIHAELSVSQVYVGNDACLFEAIHALANIHVDKTFVVDNVLQVLRIDNFLGDDADVYLRLF